VTFLFADVEGSTRLVRELGEAAWAEALAAQRAVIQERSAASGGRVVDQEGDGTFVVFATAAEALRAAAEVQAVLAEQGRVRVRLGVHTGAPLLTEDGYVGLDVHRAARIAAAAHGGQVVFSSGTRSLVADAQLPAVVRDLGEHRLKDFRPHWFGDIFVHARFQAAFPIPLHRIGRHRNDGHPWVGGASCASWSLSFKLRTRGW